MAPDSVAAANTLPLSPDTTDGHLWSCLWTCPWTGAGGCRYCEDGTDGAGAAVASAADDVAARSPQRRSCRS